MNNKKYKKVFSILVPCTDRGNNLVLEPGSTGYAILSDGKFKLGVKIEELKEALDELNELAKLYTEEKEPETFVEGAIIEGDDE